MLDLQCNAILGRPSSTAHIQDEPVLGGAGEEKESHRMLALSANFDLCSTIEVISRALTRTDSAVDESTVESYLKTLQGWTRALPEQLRHSIREESREGAPEWQHREQTLGNVNVACSYYFTVLLVTRPFLVATIVPKLQRIHGQATSSGSRATSPPSTGLNTRTSSPRRRANNGHKCQEFAQTCVGAADILIQMCHDASIRGILLDNMCILQ